MDNIELPENLEIINLNHLEIKKYFQCIMKKFPKLKQVYLNNIENLSVNPQIEVLHICVCENLSYSSLNSISIRLPNLIRFIMLIVVTP